MKSPDGDRLTPFGRFFRNLGERILRVYYEGPEPPARIRRYAEEFARLHPNATRAEWFEFSAGLAEQFYRSAWTRGFEWGDRDLDRRDPVLDPERVEHEKAHGWEWPGGGPVEDGDVVVPEKGEGR